MQPFSRTVAVSAATLLFVAGCGNATNVGSAPGPSAEDTDAPGGEMTASATPAMTEVMAALTDAEGTGIGNATFTETSGGIEVSVETDGMQTGFYGLHIHGTGLCETDSADPANPDETGNFLSAGGHLGSNVDEHPHHAGDLPSLYVTESGETSLTTVTDRFTIEDLLDDDGAAVMIHSGSDNFANIPERYAPDGPDQQTLDTGDAGERLACGVIERLHRTG